MQGEILRQYSSAGVTRADNRRAVNKSNIKPHDFIFQINMKRLIALTMVMIMAIMALEAMTYIVCVGLTNYDNGENPLPCSRADVNSIARFFDARKDAEVYMLLDRNATRAHIMKVLRTQFAKSKPNDEIIFAYSGHGFDGGLSCYDTRNVIYCNEIQKIMGNSNAKRKVMFVMACHSGSFTRYYKKQYSYANNKDSEVMLYLSSRASESSWERSDWKLSFFFKHLIDGMGGQADSNGDRKVTARELFNYVNRRVIRDTRGMQHPQMFGKFSDNMVLASY